MNLPPYLKRRQGVRTIDRSRWCRHDDLQEQAACNVCHGTASDPAPKLSDEAKALGVEPMVADDPRSSRESFIPGLS